MARIYKIGKDADKKINSLIKLTNEFYTITYKSKNALEYTVEYSFLEAFKTWENFVENSFSSHARYNDPVKGKRPYPYLAPKSEKHALELLTLEKDFIDWTSPDNIVSRAEVCFRNSAVITGPIKRNMQDLRDMKKIRNHVAHGSKESERIFKELSRTRVGSAEIRGGKYLNYISPDGVNQYSLYYLNLIKYLISKMSDI